MRLDLHLLIGVWLVTSATVFWSYLLPGQRNALAAANVGVLFLTVVLAYGYLIGTRRRLQQELVEGKQQREEDQARRALLEERARIARELHDIVAHHMSVIAVRKRPRRSASPSCRRPPGRTWPRPVRSPARR